MLYEVITTMAGTADGANFGWKGGSVNGVVDVLSTEGCAIVAMTIGTNQTVIQMRIVGTQKALARRNRMAVATVAGIHVVPVR